MSKAPIVLPLYGTPSLEPSYFSYLNNLKPAMDGTALAATARQTLVNYGALIRSPVKSREVIQIATTDEYGNPVMYSSTDPRLCGFQYEAYDKLASFGVDSVNGQYCTGLGINRAFDTFRTSGSKHMDPKLSVRLDKVGKSNGKLPAMYIRCLEAVTRIYTEIWEPQPVRINGKSKFGSPHNVYDAEDKIRIFMDAMHDVKGFTLAVARCDYDYFVRRFGGYFVTTLTNRIQVDKNGKERSGYDWLGYQTIANKHVDPSESGGYPGFNAGRVRIAYAVSGLSAILGQILMSGFRKPALETYAATWHDRYPQDILKPNEKYPHYRLFDAVQFDTTFSWEEICTIIDSMRNVSPLAKDYLRAIHRHPLLITADHLGQAGAYLINCDVYTPGLQSGVPTVSDFGKIRGTAQWMYGLCELGALVYTSQDQFDSDIKDILLHRHPFFALQNRGDDSRPMAVRKKDLDAWCNIVSALEFAKWEEDNGSKFVGHVFYKRNNNSPLEVYGDLATMLERTFINERSAGSKHRPFAASGALMRYENNMSHPGFGAVMDVINPLMVKFFGCDFVTCFERGQRLETKMADVSMPKLASLDPISREFVMNPDVIHYKYSEDQIDPDILKAFYPHYISASMSADLMNNAGFFN